MLAAQKGHLAVVEFLVKKGADVMATSEVSTAVIVIEINVGFTHTRSTLHLTCRVRRLLGCGSMDTRR